MNPIWKLILYCLTATEEFDAGIVESLAEDAAAEWERQYAETQ